MDQHFCNDNLKKSMGKVEQRESDEEEIDEDGRPVFKDETFIVKPEQIINENDKKKKSLKEMEKDFGEEVDRKQARLESNKVALDEIKNRIERKKYQEMTKDLKFNDPEDDTELKEKQQFRFTLAFGFGFISLMFLAFVCGYFLGKKILNLSETGSLIMSLGVGIGTIVMETVLFVIRMEKLEKAERQKKD